MNLHSGAPTALMPRTATHACPGSSGQVKLSNTMHGLAESSLFFRGSRVRAFRAKAFKAALSAQTTVNPFVHCSGSETLNNFDKELINQSHFDTKPETL